MRTGSTIRILNGANEEEQSWSGELPDGHLSYTGQGNIFIIEHSYTRESATKIDITSIKVTESAANAYPVITENTPSTSYSSLPVMLNTPIDLPLPSGEPRFYYLTVNGTRGKELEVFCDGNAKVYVSNEEHGFITSTEGNQPDIPGPGGLVVIPADESHDKLLITVSTQGLPPAGKDEPNCLRFSVNEKVKKYDFTVRFKGSEQAFSSNVTTLRNEFREVIEMASRCMYGATLGRARIGKVRLIVGDHVRRDVFAEVQIDPNYALPLAEANVGPIPPKQMALYREWWNYPADICAMIFVHECGHLLWSIPDEYGEGFPINDCKVGRVNFEICGNSMMDFSDLQEFCTDESHQAPPNNPNAKSSWDLMAPHLGIPKPTNTPTRFTERRSKTRIPVEITELTNP